MKRELDGVYFRVERDGKWDNICYSDLTPEEREKLTSTRSFEWFMSLYQTMREAQKRFYDFAENYIMHEITHVETKEKFSELLVNHLKRMRQEDASVETIRNATDRLKETDEYETVCNAFTSEVRKSCELAATYMVTFAEAFGITCCDEEDEEE